MRKIILVLVVLSVSLSTYAQRLNDLGLKMVKEITVNQYDRGKLDCSTKYVYEYNENNRMISIKMYVNGELRDYYTNINGKVGYQNDATQNTKCEYNFTQDRYGNITSFEYIQLDYENPKIPCWKSNYEFNYIFDEKRNVFRLEQMTYIGHNYNRSKKAYIENNNYNISKLVDYDGLLMEPRYEKRYVVDKEHPNDTNVSFYGLVNPTMWQGSTFISSFFLTEWINVRSPYFCIENWTWKHLEYVYDDKRNLIKIEDKANEDNHLVREILIEYVF